MNLLHKILGREANPPIQKAMARPTDDDLEKLALLFRYATCNDLIRLKAKYPQFCATERGSNESNSWGLKQMGTLFCAEKLLQIKPRTILEIGAGYNIFFDQHFAQAAEYWMLDDVGFYDAARFETAHAKRRATRFVRGLLGAGVRELPDGYFDCLFSISVVEHCPIEDRVKFYAEMHRVIKPGGYAVHSMDLYQLKRGLQAFEIMRNVGFELPMQPELTMRTALGQGPATLLEPLDIVFRSYFGKGRQDMWTNLQSINEHHPTILVVALKK